MNQNFENCKTINQENIYFITQYHEKILASGRIGRLVTKTARRAKKLWKKFLKDIKFLTFLQYHQNLSVNFYNNIKILTVQSQDHFPGKNIKILPIWLVMASKFGNIWKYFGQPILFSKLLMGHRNFLVFPFCCTKNKANRSISCLTQNL